jgi:hypothetical protein
MKEDTDFFKKLLEYWEKSGESGEIKKIRKIWTVGNLLECLKFEKIVSLKGVIALLSYYAIDGWLYFGVL